MSRLRLHRWRRWLLGAHADEAGTSMVEFLITLPVMILIFAGIVRLGEISRESVKVYAQAHGETFDRFHELQNQSFDDMLDDIGSAPHLSPSLAAGWEPTQLAARPPAQSNPLQTARIVKAEVDTYGQGLGFAGHFGESYERVDLADSAGAQIVGLENVITDNQARFDGMGDYSRFTRSLISDTPGLTSNSAPDDDCDSLMSEGLDYLNEAVDSAGARPMLAAGMRYGSVSGKSGPVTYNFAGKTITLEAWFNTTVASPVYSDSEAWIPEALSVVMARMAMAGCDQAPYQRLLGVMVPSQSLLEDKAGVQMGLSDQELANKYMLPQPGAWSFEAPTLEEVGFTWPFSYGEEN